MPRILHTSDTHLGHQQYSATDPEGLNQRQEDTYAAWHRTVDAAIEGRYDLFLHAGDLFDGVRPSNRALHQALSGFLKLSEAGIPAVVIAGNHEHPKMRETGSPFRLFEHLRGIHPVYKGHAETIEIPMTDRGAGPAGPLRIHAVPQCPTSQALRQEVEALQPAGDGRDLLVLHGSVPSLPAFAHAEFNELTLDPQWFTDRFAYVALGHYHGATEVLPHAWYCGAPERVSMAEAGEEKGYLEVEIDPGRPARVTFHALPGRPYTDLPVLRAEGLEGGAVEAAALEALARVPEGAVARLRIDDIDPTLRGTLDLKAIRDAARHALHLDLRLGWADVGHRVRGAAEIGGLVEEFDDFAAHQPLERLDRARVMAMAHALLGEET